MRAWIAFTAAFLLCAPFAYGQEQQPKPATKIEAFQAKIGVVLVRGFTEVGTIHGLGGDVTVDSREFRDAAIPASRITGVSIDIKETSRLERVSFPSLYSTTTVGSSPPRYQVVESAKSLLTSKCSSSLSCGNCYSPPNQNCRTSYFLRSGSLVENG